MNIDDLQVKSFKFHSYSGVNNLGKKLIFIECVDCGNIKEVRKDKFLAGSVSECICHQFILQNVIGKRINDFIVYSESVRNNRPSFLLKCIHCGELINVERYKIVANKNIPKCICKRYEGRLRKNHRCDSMIGTYIKDRHLYISEKIKMKNGRIGLKLVCTKCGKSFESSTDSVLKNQCGYCECDERYKWNTTDGAIRKYSKLLGSKINNLYIKDLFKDNQGNFRYLCDCSCGTQDISVMANRLYKGNIFSCPNCKRSFGESIIQQYLDNLNIKYISELSFDDLRGKRNMPYRFDFGIYNSEEKLLGIIEFDGMQHKNLDYYLITYNLKSEYAEKLLEEYKIRDKKKNEYCKKKGIPLLRIKYTRSKKKIEDFVYNFLVEIGGL